MVRMPTFRQLSLVISLWIKMIVLPASGRGELQNVALNKVAYQSSIDPAFEYANAAVVVDGNTDQLWDGASCSNTGYEHNPYWKVDLGGQYRIDHIRIYNRADSCCKYRSSDVRTDISVDGTNYTQVCFHAGQIPDIYTCRPNNIVGGRWVKITITSYYSDHMNLCEVEVMARKDVYRSVASRKGSGSVLQTKEGASEIACACHCSRNTNCVAVNVINSPTGNECQLLGSDDSTQTDEANISFWKSE